MKQNTFNWVCELYTFDGRQRFDWENRSVVSARLDAIVAMDTRPECYAVSLYKVIDHPTGLYWVKVMRLERAEM